MSKRRLVVLAIVVVGGLVGSALLGGTLGQPTIDDGPPPAATMIEPGDAEHHLWPYTSRERGVEGRTLAINVVIHGDRERVERTLTRTLDGNWSDAERDEGVVDDGFAGDWQSARGAARYTYVAADPSGTGRWITADYQLATGTYFGQRTHVRAYSSGELDWTALQVHTEYWDWFRLRHTVTGVASGARAVERDFRTHPGATISRVYHGQTGGGSDGWLTVIELSAVLAFAGGTRRWRSGSGTAGDLALPVILVGIVLGVRALGLALESLAPTTHPHVIAAGLYPVLAFAPPIAVSWFARSRRSSVAVLGACIGLGAGFVLDFGVVGVSVLPIELVLHRLALVAALGVLAHGVARADRWAIVAGLLAWFAGLALALVGVL